MCAVASDDFHMLANLLHCLALFSAPGPPAAEFSVEAIAIFPLIFGIVAVQFIQPLLTPRIIVGVMMFAIVMRGAKGAHAIAMIFAAIAAAFARIGCIAAVRQILVAARCRSKADATAFVPGVAIGAIIIFVIFPAPFRFLVAEPAADFISSTIEEAAFFRIIMLW